MQKNKPFFHQVRYLIIYLIILLAFGFNISESQAQGTWSLIQKTAPDVNFGSIFLLSDGTVLAKTASGHDSIGSIFDRLTPDIHGSYENGTWSTIAPMHDSRIYFSTRMLKDGRMYVAGGEYGSGGDKAEVYDPVTNQWTPVNYNGETIYDANSALLPNGEVLQAFVSFNGNVVYIYNPATNSYENASYTNGVHDETAWLTLPNQNILFIDYDDVKAEQYIPSYGEWYYTNNTPVGTYDVTYPHETGAAIMLPNGKGFFLGGSGHTLFYTPPPSGNVGTWTTGPDLPGNSGTLDAPVALMNNGKLLLVTSAKASLSDPYPSPSTFYEFNYLDNTYKQVNSPDGTPVLYQPTYGLSMLNLPNGQVMASLLGSNAYFLYTPDGVPLAAGKPSISIVALKGNSCDTFRVTGTLFNGLSEGSAYGDDWQNATNYPIVKLTRGSNVYYARTFNWNRVGVATGNLPDTAEFTLPDNVGSGSYALQVIANGIASDTVNFINTTGLISTLTPPDVCSGSVFNYHALSNIKNATTTWTRAAVGGITNAAVTVPQYADPNETLVNANSQPTPVVYKYTISGGGCSLKQNVTVMVNPSTTVINGNNLICNGSSTTLSADPGSFNFVWSTGSTKSLIIVSPSVTTTYTLTCVNQYGCLATATKTVRLHVCTGIEPTDSGAAELLDVYPNPVKDQCIIKFKAKAGGSYTLKLADMLGRTLKQQSGEAKSGENITTLNFDGLPNGLYLLVFKKDDAVEMIKVVK